MGNKTSPTLILPLQRRGRKRENRTSPYRGEGGEKRKKNPLLFTFNPPPSLWEGGGKRRGMGEETSPTYILPLLRRGRKRERRVSCSFLFCI